MRIGREGREGTGDVRDRKGFILSSHHQHLTILTSMCLSFNSNNKKKSRKNHIYNTVHEKTKAKKKQPSSLLVVVVAFSSPFSLIFCCEFFYISRIFACVRCILIRAMLNKRHTAVATTTAADRKVRKVQ